MERKIDKLLSLGGEITSSRLDIDRLLQFFGEDIQPLLPILQVKNGLYAFESALHLYSENGNDSEKGLVFWNQNDTWRGSYQGSADHGIFFAEDIFANQFVLERGLISKFYPETGEYRSFANNLEHWADLILRDFEEVLGFQLAHEWQVANGAIPAGHRLAPKIPFVLGGEYTVSNIYSIETIESLLFRASIAVQIRDLPDGTKIRIVLED